jgi:hypothetical protein
MTNTQHSQETGIHASGGIQTQNPSKQAATGYLLSSLATGIGWYNITDNNVMLFPFYCFMFY